MPDPMPQDRSWPALSFEEGKDTYATLHMWLQIVGKIRRMQSPWTNHSWHVTLYLTARGLTTSPIPYGTRTFQIDFDFIDHRLLVMTNEGMIKTLPLQPKPVAAFYRELFDCLAELGLAIRIHARPNEVIAPVPFAQDDIHASYDVEYANRLWRVLTQADRVFKQFRTGFIGKCSPVHLFWGSFDLAVTRFSGRTAPQHPGGIPNCPDWIVREAYSHEVSSCGFWPGNDALPYPVFYAYAYPEPPGFHAAQVQPAEASYSQAFGEFILPYAVVRQAPSPDGVLRDFLQSSYEAAANLGKWDRATLEREGPQQMPRSGEPSVVGPG